MNVTVTARYRALRLGRVVTWPSAGEPAWVRTISTTDCVTSGSVTTLGRALADEVGGSRIGGFLNTAFSNKAGELVIPAMVTGSLAKPKFGPDAEAMARLRVQSFEPEKAKEQVQKIFDIFRKK